MSFRINKIVPLRPYCRLLSPPPSATSIDRARRREGDLTTKATMSFRINRMTFNNTRYCGLGYGGAAPTFPQRLPAWARPGVRMVVESAGQEQP